jgi:hypothetical protein
MESFDAHRAVGIVAPLRAAARRALGLLRREHRWMLERLTTVESVVDDDDPEAGDIVRVVCTELLGHSALEHQLLYPALDSTLSDMDATGVARVEHELLDQLAARLLRADPGDPLFRPRVRALRAALSRHIATEEAWFGEALEAPIDWPRLLAALQTRQRERRRLQRAQPRPRTHAGYG